MANVNINVLYCEILAVKKKIERLEDILIPEEELTGKELKALDKLRGEALEEHRKGQTVKLSEL